MTTEEIVLIKKSWKKLQGVNPLLIADLFYSKLFTDKPALRKMFPLQMEAQYNKLTDMLHTIVSRLDMPYLLNQEITLMAERHRKYGVRPAHYIMVGNALLWTLEKALDKDWSGATRDAWLKCYSKISGIMMNPESKNSNGSFEIYQGCL